MAYEDSATLREFQHLLDGTVHGIRGPLRGIGTSAGFLSQKWNDRLDEEGRRLLRSILDGVSVLNQFTKSLADYSMSLLRSNQAPASPLPVDNAVQAALAALTPQIEETGATVYCGPLPRLAIDHEQLTLLFRCLIGNAVEFRKPGGPPRVEITATRAGDEWRFAVSDDGVGIAPRYHRQIFEPYERLHGNRCGWGLGLAIAKKIVSSHGGRLWVDSNEGEGSTFFFTLPDDQRP